METREQVAFLRDYDCDQMQGFYFSPALPRDNLRQMVSGDVRLPDQARCTTAHRLRARYSIV